MQLTMASFLNCSHRTLALLSPMHSVPLGCGKLPSFEKESSHQFCFRSTKALTMGAAFGSSPLLSFIAWLGVFLLYMQSANAMSTVSGSVYCDQCLDGHRTIWGAPLDGAKVVLECKNKIGQVTLSTEGSTNMLGQYSIKVDGSPTMEGCATRVLSSSSKSCSIAGVASRSVSLSWKLFGLSFYSAEALSYKPSRPMSFCPKTSKTEPKISLPPLPFAKLSACPYKYWVDPQYKCYWRLISPNTKVSLFYGEAVGKKYGANTTLWQGLHGGGEVHKVLLRESIAASLNAFNSMQFYYNAISVDVHVNQAIEGTDKDVLRWALAFRRANSGYGGKANPEAKCLMTPCK